MQYLQLTLLSPILMARALAPAWSPGKQIPLLSLALLAPFFGTALAVLTVVLVKRFLSRLSGLAFIIAPALQVGGLAGVAWLVINLSRGAGGGDRPVPGRGVPAREHG